MVGHHLHGAGGHGLHRDGLPHHALPAQGGDLEVQEGEGRQGQEGEEDESNEAKFSRDWRFGGRNDGWKFVNKQENIPKKLS